MLAQETPFVLPTCPGGSRFRPPAWPTAIGDGMDDAPTVVVHVRDELLRPALSRMLHARGYHVIETGADWELELVLDLADVRFVVVRDDTERILTSMRRPDACAVCWWDIDQLATGPIWVSQGEA